jgi:hypothetical protein
MIRILLFVIIALTITGCGVKRETISIDYATDSIIFIGIGSVTIFDFEDGPFLEGQKIKYRYREILNRRSPISTGEGVLFEKYLKRKIGNNHTHVVDDGGELLIKTDILKLEWSSGGPSTGWLYYKSSIFRAMLVPKTQFDDVDLAKYSRWQ